MSAPKYRKRSDYRFFLVYRTRWSDNDQYGHLNNSIYNFLIDSVVNSYLIEHCGLQPTDTNSAQIGLVVSSHCSYFESLAFPELVELGLRVDKLGTSSVIYEVGFFRQAHDRACAVGGFVHVFVDRESRRPVKALEAKMKEGLGKLAVMPKAAL
ncbi:thioesterase [Sphaerosporella brunnea]|uniref:Thioesterase n=1 Tax=Sphaerosporella brunnea TaxID=1250544 RepID=A0A5J5EF85_9PEZI|nr:thioesterase [Sphaerosporella brunnea]